MANVYIIHLKDNRKYYDKTDDTKFKSVHRRFFIDATLNFVKENEK